MTKTNSAFTRKKALSVVLVIGLLLAAAIMLRLFLPQNKAPDLTTLDGRESFFNSLGWEIDRDSEEFRSVRVPETLEGIMQQYNKMQLSQGYDLSLHAGKMCSQYTYRLLNYPGSDSTVMISIYILDGEVIAGDIHTATANGFMHGLKRDAQ